MARKLNIGIILTNDEICLGEFNIIKDLIQADCVNITLLVNILVSDSCNGNTNRSRIYLLHERLDKYFFKNRFDFDRKINLREHFSNVQLITLKETDLFNDRTDKDIQDIHKYDLDLLLDFSHTPLRKDLCNFSGLGILSIKNTDSLRSCNTPWCYWEVIMKAPEIEIQIVLNDLAHDEEIVLYRTWISPNPNSININRDNTYKVSSLLIARIINGLFRNGPSYFEELRKNSGKVEQSSSPRNLDSPTSFRALINLMSFIIDYTKRRLKNKLIENWFLIIADKKPQGPPYEITSYTKLSAPKGKLWADPFLLTKDNHHYLYVEEYEHELKKAHISVLTLDSHSKVIKNDVIIEKPYHLSYPQVFEYNNCLYMIPETGSNKTIELYKCSGIPSKWEFVQNIMQNIAAKDSTMLFYNNKWWLFTTVANINVPDLYYNELYLYYSDDMLSLNWHEHPKNPIVWDHKFSRSAGNIFIYKNELYRPSQDCSGQYGKALNINKIVKLNENEYEEVLVSRNGPMELKKLRGMHTINFDSEFVVADAY